MATLAGENQPAKPASLLSEGHTHQERSEEFPTTLNLHAISGANVSAQVITFSPWTYELGGVVTIPPVLPPLPPLRIERESSDIRAGVGNTLQHHDQLGEPGPRPLAEAQDEGLPLI
jgi:hypothetical protein